jgi:carboxyl-terminal processing protease
VIDIDPDILFDNAVEGIMESLDPYTAYFPIEEEEKYELFTQGTYTGFGISVDEEDSMIVITRVTKDNSAYNAGLRAGDKIFQIDTVNMVGMSVDSLTNYTDGEEGSTAFVRIIRGADTLDKTLLRDKIDSPDVPYYGIIDGDIAYIRLAHFTTSSVSEFRAALNDMKEQNENLAGLIIDLRGNPGGVLTASTGIADLFLPEDTLITSTKGKNNYQPVLYKSEYPAEEPEMKVAILINGSSASASEALAGAFQDLDRGVILGTQSFGKGLVQSFFSLPFDNKIKITTAKYYTPSGRCIQKRNFADEYRLTPEDTTTVKFTTRNGRPLKDAAGIIPDSTIERPEYDEIVSDLYYNNAIFNFAVKQSRKLGKLPDGYKLGNEEFDDFLDFLKETEYKPDTYEHRLIESLNEHIAEKEYDEQVINEVKNLETVFEKTNLQDVVENKEPIMELIEQDIYSYYYKEDEYTLDNIDKDIQAITACKILKSDTYQKLLTVEKTASEGKN